MVAASASRRRDLTATNYTPMIRTFTNPVRAVPGPLPTRTAVVAPPRVPEVVVSSTEAAVESSPTNAPAAVVVPDPRPAVFPPRRLDADAATMGTRLIYANPTYQPYTVGGRPYTYQQYSSAYYPYGVYTNPSVPPITVQRYTQTIGGGAGYTVQPVPVQSSPGGPPISNQ
jgi:hypothetical protein